MFTSSQKKKLRSNNLTFYAAKKASSSISWTIFKKLQFLKERRIL